MMSGRLEHSRLSYGRLSSSRMTLGSGGGGGGDTAIAALFSAVNADGWSATYTSPPTFDPAGSPEYFTVTRDGYDATASTTTHTENLVCTERVRQVYPNQASLTTDQVSLSDYVYSTDTITGATNSSTEVSPKPIAQWGLPDRVMVGDTITIEIVAAHRNARDLEEIAAAVVRATDGTTEVSQTVATSTISTRSSDVYGLTVYTLDLDVSSLADPSTVTVNAKLYPWVGGAASVLDSADQTDEREFSPRVYRRDTARFAAPPLAYVDGVGGGTPVVSTTPATAAASPYATIQDAIAGLKAATGVTGGKVDGCEIRLTAANHLLGGIATATSTGAQDVAAFIITPAPGVTQAQAVVQIGSSPNMRYLEYITFRGVTISRTGTGAINSISPGGRSPDRLLVSFDDIIFTSNGYATNIVSGFTELSVYGMVCTDTPGSGTFNAAGTGTANARRIFRGVDCQFTGTFEKYCLLASRFTQPELAAGTRSEDGTFWASVFVDADGAVSTNLLEVGDFTGGETISFAALNVVANYISTTAANAFFFLADASLSATRHGCIHNCTAAGFFNHGRSNSFYDEGTAQTDHKMVSQIGNIWVSVNTKGDVFKLDGTRIGNFPFLYGVGVRDNFVQFDSASTSFRQEYSGVGTTQGTSTTVAEDPVFVSPNHTPDGVTPGTAGGDYNLDTGSPCLARVASAPLRFDIEGTTRSATAASIGAYE